VTNLEKLFAIIADNGNYKDYYLISLAMKMLQVDPMERITPKKVLENRFVKELSGILPIINKEVYVKK
jgi:hypothetical protein